MRDYFQNTSFFSFFLPTTLEYVWGFSLVPLLSSSGNLSLAWFYLLIIMVIAP